MNLKRTKLLKILWQDESGQATTEYVMLLFVLSGMIFTLGNAFQKKLKKLIEGTLTNSLNKRIFNPQAMHRFPF